MQRLFLFVNKYNVYVCLSTFNILKIIHQITIMGLITRLLSLFFYEYNIPSEPIKFIAEAFFLVVFGIPYVITSIISYVYFPPEPKNVEGKVILVCINTHTISLVVTCVLFKRRYLLLILIFFPLLLHKKKAIILIYISNSFIAINVN